jgi:hypothetical protein
VGAARAVRWMPRPRRQRHPRHTVSGNWTEVDTGGGAIVINLRFNHPPHRYVLPRRQPCPAWVGAHGRRSVKEADRMSWPGAGPPCWCAWAPVSEGNELGKRTFTPQEQATQALEERSFLGHTHTPTPRKRTARSVRMPARRTPAASPRHLACPSHFAPAPGGERQLSPATPGTGRGRDAQPYRPPRHFSSVPRRTDGKRRCCADRYRWANPSRGCAVRVGSGSDDCTPGSVDVPGGRYECYPQGAHALQNGVTAGSTSRTPRAA